MEARYLGTVGYRRALSIIEENLTEVVQQKKIIVQGQMHPLVYTSGLKFDSTHVIDSSLEIIPVRRGGSVTLHNHGQLVIYPLMSFERVGRDLEKYIRLLESVTIRAMAQCNLYAFIKPPHSGVFTQNGKLAFVGVGLKKNCLVHGISININNNLKDYNSIYSCGLTIPATNFSEQKSLPMRWENLLSQDSEKFIRLFFKIWYDEFRRCFEEEVPIVFRKKTNKHFRRFGFEPLVFGLSYFNQRMYWQAHEAWELYWRILPKPEPKSGSKSEERSMVQALICLASALFKIHDKPNLEGAKSLLKKSISHAGEAGHLMKKVIALGYQDVVDFSHYLLSSLEKASDTEWLVSDETLKKQLAACLLLFNDEI